MLRLIFHKYYRIRGNGIGLKHALILVPAYFLLSFIVNVIWGIFSLGSVIGGWWVPLYLLTYASTLYLLLIVGRIRHRREVLAQIGETEYFKYYPKKLRRVLKREMLNSSRRQSWRNDMNAKIDYTVFRDDPMFLKRELKRELRLALSSPADYANFGTKLDRLAPAAPVPEEAEN